MAQLFQHMSAQQSATVFRKRANSKRLLLAWQGADRKPRFVTLEVPLRNKTEQKVRVRPAQMNAFARFQLVEPSETGASDALSATAVAAAVEIDGRSGWALTITVQLNLETAVDRFLTSVKP